MSADPDAQRLRSFGHRCVLMADRLEKYCKALQEIAAERTPDAVGLDEMAA